MIACVFKYLTDVRVLILFFAISTTHAKKQCSKEHDFSTDHLFVHNDCDKFFMCNFGNLIEMLCPAGLYFNPEISKCDWKQNVDCRRNLSGDDENRSENSEAVNDYNNESQENNNASKEGEMELDESNSEDLSGKPIFLENGCPINSSSHWLLPHENNCNLFYYCVHGQKLQRQCPGPLHFNFYLQVCDWPDKAGCDDSSESDNDTSQEESKEHGNSQEDKDSQENDNSQEDNNNSQEDSQENGNSQEDYSSEENGSVEDEIEDDTSEEPSYQKTKSIEAIVKVNLKAMKF